MIEAKHFDTIRRHEVPPPCSSPGHAKSLARDIGGKICKFKGKYWATFVDENSENIWVYGKNDIYSILTPSEFYSFFIKDVAEFYECVGFKTGKQNAKTNRPCGK